MKEALISTYWSPVIAAKLMSYSKISSWPHLRRAAGCDMCNKTVHQNRTGVVLYGFKYDSGILQSGDFTALVPCLRGERDLPIPDAREGLSPEDHERVFDMGMYCFQKATYFHGLHHFPATLLTALLVCAFMPAVRAAIRLPALTFF